MLVSQAVHNAQQQTTQACGEIRKGRGAAWFRREVAGQNVYNNLVVPVQEGRNPWIIPHQQKSGNKVKLPGRQKGVRNLQNDILQDLPTRGDEREEDLVRQMPAVLARMRLLNRYHGLQYNRMLASGGSAVAALFDFTPPNGPADQVVIKIHLNNQQFFANREYRKHVVSPWSRPRRKKSNLPH